jgi:hypothetical protein
MEGNRGGTTAKAHQIYMEVTQGWSIPYHLDRFIFAFAQYSSCPRYVILPY